MPEGIDLEALRGENRQLRARLADLDFLAGMAERLEKHISVDDLQVEILNRLADTLGAEVASLMMLDAGSGELRIRASRGLSEEIVRATRVKLGQDISGRVAASGRGLVAEDVEQLFGRPNRATYRTRSCLSVPLKFQGQVRGVLNFADKRDGGFKAADLELAARLAGQAASLLVTVMSHGALVRQERHEREMQFAHTLQQAFLPGRPPEAEGLLLAARYVPALEVGGDFYDFIPLADGRLGVLVGDVAGKGIPAALFMARFSSDFRSLALSGLSPAEAMTRANQAVVERSRRGLFVTAVYGIFDGRSGEVLLSNAGHPVPLLRSAGSGAVRGIAEAIDVPLGVVPGTRYAEARLEFAPGETLLFMTDGAFDARGPEGARYGIDRLVDTVGRDSARPRETVERLMADVMRFVGPGARSDDLTIVAVGRDG